MTLSVQDIWNDVAAVRKTAPLVHSITNLVVMSYNANALLALGAAPVMAHAREEVEEMVAIAGALVLNIGTLQPEWVEAMKLAAKKAASLNKPIILDPVGAGATSYRNRTITELLVMAKPAVIRGNASEIMSVSGLDSATKGVESLQSSEAAIDAAKTLARKIDGYRLCFRCDGHYYRQKRQDRLSAKRPSMDDENYRNRLFRHRHDRCIHSCTIRLLACNRIRHGLSRCRRRICNGRSTEKESGSGKPADKNSGCPATDAGKGIQETAENVPQRGLNTFEIPGGTKKSWVKKACIQGICSAIASLRASAFCRFCSALCSRWDFRFLPAQQATTPFLAIQSQLFREIDAIVPVGPEIPDKGMQYPFPALPVRSRQIVSDADNGNISGSS